MNLKRVLLSSIVIFWGCVLFAQQTGPNSDVNVITKGWYEQIQANLLKQEYYLHLKKDKHYRAFNRSNNIIGQLKPGAMNLTPKLDSGQTTVPWQAELETVSIVFDNHLVYTPTQTALITSDENTVEFHHGKYTEQYINNEQGLRQNFIIHEGPQSKTIHVNLNLKGLRVNKRHDTELAFYEGTPKGGIQAHTLYKDLKSWDAHGLPLASHFEVMGDQVSIVVSAQNATYPITIDPISTTAATQLEGNQATAYFGRSVSSAGDVNGDGYSDVIVGANYYDNGQSNEGAAFLYLGNNGGANNLGVLKDYDDNLSSLYSSSSFADANRGVGLTSKSFLGRQKAKLVYETKAGGNSFSGSPVTTGVTTTGSQASYSDLGTSGTELKTTYAKNNFLRVRLKYDPVTSITGQVYSPWRYMTNYKLSNTPLPVDLTYFEAQPRINHTALLSWSTASEINNSHFEIERSYDGSTFEIVGEVAGNGNSQHLIEYTFKDESISLIQNTVFYRLKQVDFDGTYEYSDIRVVRFDRIGEGMHLIVYPNPFLDEVTLMVSLPQGEDYSLEITDLKGAKVHQSNHTFTSGVHLLNLAKWNKGVYLVEVVSKQGSEHLKVMKK